MIGVTSGRMAFAKYAGDYLPITNFKFSSTNNRIKRYLANGGNWPRREAGTHNSQLSVSGLDFYPNFLDDEITISVGWLTGSIFDYVDFVGVPVKIDYEFDFRIGANPPFQWTISLEGTSESKDFLTVPEEVINTIFCDVRSCGPITTTDASLHSGEVFHVRKAVYSVLFQRPMRYLANSNNRIAPSTGLYDGVLSFEIEGDFDYWTDLAEHEDTARVYRIYHGSEYIETPLMSVISVTDLVANVQTGEIISATVNLGVNS